MRYERRSKNVQRFALRMLISRRAFNEIFVGTHTKERYESVDSKLTNISFLKKAKKNS